MRQVFVTLNWDAPTGLEGCLLDQTIRQSTIHEPNDHSYTLLIGQSFSFDSFLKLSSYHAQEKASGKELSVCCHFLPGNSQVGKYSWLSINAWLEEVGL